MGRPPGLRVRPHPRLSEAPGSGSHTLESTCLIAAHVLSGPVIHLNAKMLTNTLTWSFLNAYLTMGICFQPLLQAQPSCLQIR